MVLMWSTVMVGVALAGEVYVGFLDPYPFDFGMIGGTGLIVFLASVWLLQQLVEGRDITRRYSHGKVRLFGIVVSAVMLLVIAHVPAIVGNMLFGLALFSQIIWPLMTALRDIRAEG